ncbi:HTH-type transcriptional regulator McbR [Tritonibacter multivorans]|uniref:HTH-type transcriptional regulator McbR n=1 Tax=Tritonibacter multivorans TaxID=928856 RepID=A0A0P1GG38_9RHOB|nr:GntR family transcriptional regulator [Tritonibacter multivorans]MDA7420907.1 GntR family transcriptional regulator [Tritonibacter multivorans]CUH80539.1 HTH-type transcriptional regulator McbR [Tritonibacter multivorans]SFC82523.1 transcriptional regulator, GntR family [Tritonibacter multivorans]
MAGRRLVQKQSLPEIIANDLRERILSGEIPEGAAIQQEVLAEEYGVSRMPVREALKRLNAEGLLSWETNRGGSVVKHSLNEIGEIFDLRALIEVDLFRRAIPNMTATDFMRCEELLAEMEVSYAANDVARWGQLNHDYHTALYRAANRRLTDDVLIRIALQSDRYVRIHLSVMKQRDPAREEHRKLLDLAQQGDVAGAGALLERHILRTRDALLELVAKQRSQMGD